jgi:hypothetical protein
MLQTINWWLFMGCICVCGGTRAADVWKVRTLISSVAAGIDDHARAAPATAHAKHSYGASTSEEPHSYMRLLVCRLSLLCAALDAFCESLDAAEILPYMPQLISELLQVLQMGRPGVQEMALSAVSSIASAAEQAFQPYTGEDARATAGVA